MFENTELPLEFNGQPVRTGDQYKFLPNGIIHTVIFRPEGLNFLLQLNDSDASAVQMKYTSLLSLKKSPDKWERV